MATLSVSVTNSDPTVPVTLVGTFDPAFIDVEKTPMPETCETAQSGMTCQTMNGDTLSFAVDVGRVQNNTRFEDFRFTVSVPDAYVDTDMSNNSDFQRVERFGKDLVDNGDAGGASDDSSTSDDLQPSDTSSPVVETIEEAAETFTKVARTVTLAEKRPANDRTSSTRSRGMKPAKAVKDTTARTVDEKSGGTTSRATGADRRDAIRDERHSRAETSDKKSSDGAERSQKESTDTSPTAVTTFAESTSGIVDTVVKGVKKIL